LLVNVFITISPSFVVQKMTIGVTTLLLVDRKVFDRLRGVQLALGVNDEAFNKLFGRSRAATN
jgi:hypothetical protein